LFKIVYKKITGTTFCYLNALSDLKIFAISKVLPKSFRYSFTAIFDVIPIQERRKKLSLF